MARACPRCGTVIRGLVDECPGCGLDQPIPVPWYYMVGLLILMLAIAWTVVDFDELTYFITQFGPMRIGN
jgi:hypothetical protein